MNEKTPTPTPTADNTAARLFRELAADMNDEQAERALRDLLFARWPFLRPDVTPPKPCPRCAMLDLRLLDKTVEAQGWQKQCQDLRAQSAIHEREAADSRQPFRFPRYGDRFRVVKDKLEGYCMSKVKVGDMITFGTIGSLWPMAVDSTEKQIKDVQPAIITRDSMLAIPFACLEYIGPAEEGKA